MTFLERETQWYGSDLSKLLCFFEKGRSEDFKKGRRRGAPWNSQLLLFLRNNILTIKHMFMFLTHPGCFFAGRRSEFAACSRNHPVQIVF